MQSIIICSNKIYYAVITKVKDSSISNKNNYYNYTHNIVPYKNDSNKYHRKYSAFSNRRDKYFLVHSVWHRKAYSHNDPKVMLLVTVHTELSQPNSFRMWSTGQTTPGAGDLEKPPGKLHSEEDWIHKKRDM